MQVLAFCRCFVNSLQYVGHKTTWPMCRTSTHWLSSYKVVMSRHECELLYFTTASPTYIVGEAIYNGAGKPWNNTAQIHLQKIFRQGGSSGENWGNKDHKHISASFANCTPECNGRVRLMHELSTASRMYLTVGMFHHCTGCGALWVTDGIWKLSFQHCMHRVEVHYTGSRHGKN